MYTSAILLDNDLVNRKEDIMNIEQFTDKVDVDVFAAVAEAHKWVALMSCKVDDSRSADKHVYDVRYHAID